MHLQFYLRGLPQELTLWKAMAQSQFFLWRRKDITTGEDDNTLLQAGLRDSVLGTYEYIFPKESLSTVLAMMKITEPDYMGCDPTIGRKFKLAVLRKMTGTRKIPKKYFEEAKNIDVSIELGNSERGLSHLRYGVTSIHLIGIKYDKVGEMVHPVTGKGWIQELI